MSLRSIALALALALGVMQASSATNHPVEKVVDLLKKLSEKVCPCIGSRAPKKANLGFMIFWVSVD